jgi:hypothetical protein
MTETTKEALTGETIEHTTNWRNGRQVGPIPPYSATVPGLVLVLLATGTDAAGSCEASFVSAANSYVVLLGSQNTRGEE